MTHLCPDAFFSKRYEQVKAFYCNYFLLFQVANLIHIFNLQTIVSVFYNKSSNFYNR